MRPTRDGWGALALLGAVAAVALVTGSNLVYLLLGVLLAALLVDAALGGWNLRGLTVARALPTELYAETEAVGAYVVSNPRRIGAARDLELTERGGEGGGRAISLAAGREARVRAGWTFPERGAARLEGVRVASSYPLGLFDRARDLSLPAELVVYPRPRSGRAAVGSRDGDERAGASRAAGAFGDFAGLREYRPGDPVRAIHWPTSARTAQPVVVLRTGEEGEELCVRVDPHAPWERAIGRACGQVIRGFDRGCAVGLELPGKTFGPGRGPDWRRTLLDALVRQPRRGAR